MGTSTFETEYTRLQKATGDSSAGTLTYYKQILNDAYQEFCEAHDWPWLHYTGAVNLTASYDTGTITTVNSGTDYVTTTGTWSTAWSPMRLRTAAGHDYLLTYSSGASQWQMDRDLVEVETGVAYTLYKDVYSLAARLRSLTLAWPTVSPDYPCKIVTPSEMRILKTEGISPRDPVSHICMTDVDTTNLVSQVEVYPVPDAAHTLHYKGYLQVATLSSTGDAFQFPAQLLHAYRALALANTWDWRGRSDLAAAERQKYEVALNRAVNRADPNADAGAKVELDPWWFQAGRYKDSTPRLGEYF